jgi:WD40 repeat protein
MFESQSSIIERHQLLSEVSGLKHFINDFFSSSISAGDADMEALCVVKKINKKAANVNHEVDIELSALPSTVTLHGNQAKDTLIRDIVPYTNDRLLILVDNTLQVWDTHSSMKLISIHSMSMSYHHSKVYGSLIHDLPDRIITFAPNRSVVIYDMPSMTADNNRNNPLTIVPLIVRATLTPRTAQGVVADWHFNGTKLYVNYASEAVVVVDLLNLTIVSETAIRVEYPLKINRLSTTMNGEILLAACSDRFLRMWDISGSNPSYQSVGLLDHSVPASPAPPDAYRDHISLPFAVPYFNKRLNRHCVFSLAFYDMPLDQKEIGLPVWELELLRTSGCVDAHAETETTVRGRIIATLGIGFDTRWATCYDIDEDHLLVGTVFGQIFMWHMETFEMLFHTVLSIRPYRVLAHGDICCISTFSDINPVSIWSIKRQSKIAEKKSKKRTPVMAIGQSALNNSKVLFVGDNVVTATLL